MTIALQKLVFATMFSYEQSMLKTFASKLNVIMYWLVKKSYNGEIDHGANISIWMGRRRFGRRDRRPGRSPWGRRADRAAVSRQLSQFRDPADATAASGRRRRRSQKPPRKCESISGSTAPVRSLVLAGLHFAELADRRIGKTHRRRHAASGLVAMDREHERLSAARRAAPCVQDGRGTRRGGGHESGNRARPRLLAENSRAARHPTRPIAGGHVGCQRPQRIDPDGRHQSGFFRADHRSERQLRVL